MAIINEIFPEKMIHSLEQGVATDKISYVTVSSSMWQVSELLRILHWSGVHMSC